MFINSATNAVHRSVNKTKSGTGSDLEANVVNPYAPPITPSSQEDHSKEIALTIATLLIGILGLFTLQDDKKVIGTELDLGIAPAAGGPPEAYPKKITEEGKRVTNPLYDPNFGRMKLIHKTI